MKYMEFIYPNKTIVSKSFTIFWFINGRMSIPHPAGLVQDFVALVACPAPALVLWSLRLDKLRRPVSQLGPYVQQQMLMTQFETLPFWQAGARQATQIKRLFTQACVCVVSMEGMNLGPKSQLDAQPMSEGSNVPFLHTLSSAEWWMFFAKIITYLSSINKADTAEGVW